MMGKEERGLTPPMERRGLGWASRGFAWVVIRKRPRRKMASLERGDMLAVMAVVCAWLVAG